MRCAGWSFGFTRMTTLDGASYPVNLLGEYWLVNTVGTTSIANFRLQARNNKTAAGGTSLVGFAMHGGNSPTVEVRNLLFITFCTHIQFPSRIQHWVNTCV